MQTNDYDRFSKVICGLAEAYGIEVSPMTIALYFKALAEYQLADIEGAIVKLLQTHKFKSLPTVAEFIECMGGGSVEDIALVEATKVWWALSSVGSWKSVVFDDPYTQAVIQRCFDGWVKLCSEMTVNEQKWFLMNFVNHYKAMKNTNTPHYGKLPGQISLGGGDDQVIYIGNKQKALAIEAKGKEQETKGISFGGKVLPYDQN